MRKLRITILILILVTIDQVSKFMVSQLMSLHQHIYLTDFFSLYYTRNDGAAFSVLSGKTELFYMVTALAIAIVAYFFKNSKSRLGISASIVMLAGILGNFIDRLFYKEVIDFISIKIFNYQFAIFNIADTYITIAVVMYIIDFIIVEKKERNGKNKDKSDGPKSTN